MMRNPHLLTKVSIHATNPEDKGFRTLVKDVLKGEETVIAPGLSVFIMPNGTIFEIYGPGTPVPDYLFSHGKIVNSYQVPDLQSAVELLEKKGARVLGQVIQMPGSDYYYCHVGFEDGSVVGLFQYKDKNTD